MTAVPTLEDDKKLLLDLIALVDGLKRTLYEHRTALLRQLALLES